jgi:hypothetical protein
MQTSIQIYREEPRFAWTGGVQPYPRTGYDWQSAQALDAPRFLCMGGMRSQFVDDHHTAAYYYLSSTAMREGA